MLIDRERFLRAALLLNLGGAPVAGCIIAEEDGTQDQGQPVQQQQTSGGEQQTTAVQQTTYRNGPPVQVVGPAQEGPAYEGGPVYEGGGPAYEGGGPAYEGGPVYE